MCSWWASFRKPQASSLLLHHSNSLFPILTWNKYTHKRYSAGAACCLSTGDVKTQQERNTSFKFLFVAPNCAGCCHAVKSSWLSGRCKFTKIWGGCDHPSSWCYVPQEVIPILTTCQLSVSSGFFPALLTYSCWLWPTLGTFSFFCFQKSIWFQFVQVFCTKVPYNPQKHFSFTRPTFLGKFFIHIKLSYLFIMAYIKHFPQDTTVH